MNELRALTSLRGLAAFYVVLLHFSSAIQRHTDGNIPALAPRGHLAVDFFFVLSGFIMAYSYSKDFQSRGLAAMPSFLLKRVARVMPLHWFLTAALLFYTLWVSPNFMSSEMPAFNSPDPGQDVALNALLLQGLGFAPNMNGPSWSISVEMFAYLAFPFFLLPVFSLTAALRWLATGAAIALLVVTALQRPDLSLDTVGSLGTGWTVARGFAEFALGMAAHRAFSVGQSGFASDRVIFAFTALAAAMMLGRLWDLIAVLTFPFIILGVAANHGIVNRLLSHRVPYFMGVVSFSLYLVHSPVAYLELQVVKYLHPALLDRPVALLLAAVGALTVIPLAWVIYHLVEHPGRDAIRGIAERMRAAGLLRQAD